MFEPFTNYPGLKWSAGTAAQSYSGLDTIQFFPDLENFKLERFRDLRSELPREEDDPFKVMLIGSSKTNIFIDGPDYLINILLIYLPQYVGKSWSAIQNIKFEGVLEYCSNYLISTRCDPWIIDRFELKEIKPGQKIHYATSNDFEKADEICIRCDNFEVKQSVT